jgi:alpha-ketoglutarate-dependent dioxygenase FTO
LSHFLQAGVCATVKQIRSEQLALNEVEFEWIRQFFVQGERHRELHKWWHKPFEKLLELWAQLECRTRLVISTLADAAGQSDA